MKELFTHGWPKIGDDEIAAVERVLRSGRINYWTGSETRQFETSFADFVQTDHAIALANGTVALELALRSVGIGPGDDVVVTSRSFIASAGAVSLVGASPVFADVDPVSQNVTVETIEDAITYSTKAILVVHLGGWPCDMDPIVELAEEHDLIIIEDCAQALGASYKGRPMGSWGAASAWSFCQDKILTTGGEGGMLTTNDEAVFDRAWSYKDHGKDRAKMMNSTPGPSYKWVHDDFGTNWRMTEMQAAIGNVALPKVPGWVERRREIAALFDRRFAEVDALRTTVPGVDYYHSYYKYYVFLRLERIADGWDRDRILTTMSERDIPAFSGICGEIYREQAFEDGGFAPEERLPVAEELSESALMIPVHPELSDEIVLEAADAVARVVQQAQI